MVNAPKVETLLRNLSTYVGYLRRLAKTNRASFLNNPEKIGAAKYYLQIAIASCIDTGTHVISSERYRAPKDYSDVFSVLAEHQIIPADFASTLRKMARLRNLLVHIYWEVDDEQVYDDLQLHLGDFDRFTQYILQFIKHQTK